MLKYPPGGQATQTFPDQNGRSSGQFYPFVADVVVEVDWHSRLPSGQLQETVVGFQTYPLRQVTHSLRTELQLDPVSQFTQLPLAVSNGWAAGHMHFPSEIE